MTARHGLPTSLDPEVDTDAILTAVERDKKRRQPEGVRFVLLKSLQTLLQPVGEGVRQGNQFDVLVRGQRLAGRARASPAATD